MGPIGWPEIVALLFYAAVIAGVVWLIRSMVRIREDVAAIRRMAEDEAKQKQTGSKPNPPSSDGQ